jgi:micrococcal nuclease
MGCITSKEVLETPAVTVTTPVTTPAVTVTTPVETQLLNSTYENTEVFSPTFTKAKVVRVYDGDTIHVSAIVCGKVYRFIIRMYGYDSPELRTKDLEEKLAGYDAKEFLSKRIGGKIVDVFIHPIKEKFGRLLATISDSDGEVNSWMIANGHGKAYFGGTKEKYQA